MKPLPSTIVWIAAHAPVPPYTGGKLKTRTALTLCAEHVHIHVITFAAQESINAVRNELTREWGSYGVAVTVLPLREGSNSITALRHRKLLTTTRLPLEEVLEQMKQLGGTCETGLVILDDIALAPMLSYCGMHTLFSPHDCISAMELSSLHQMAVGPRWLRQYLQYIVSLHYERTYYHNSLLVHLVTDRDRKNLLDVNAACRCHVVPYRDDSVTRSNARDKFTHDVVIWTDLNRDGLLQGTIGFVREALRGSLNERKVLIVGKVTSQEALQKLRTTIPSNWEYSRLLEDDQGAFRYGRVTVVPDIGGAGIKSRILNVISRGDCVAALYEQMSGIDGLADVGALNSFSMNGLVKLVERALDDGSWEQIGLTGQAMLDEEMNETVLRRKWLDMIVRAMTIKQRVH